MLLFIFNLFYLVIGLNAILLFKFNILYVQVGLNAILPANYPILVRTTVAQHYLTCVCNVILLLNGLTLILTLSCGLWVSIRVMGVYTRYGRP
jgi:hypothetical protein